MTPMLYIIGSFLSCGFIAFGWGGEGILHQFCLIIGGLYIGAILAEAANHKEET